MNKDKIQLLMDKKLVIQEMQQQILDDLENGRNRTLQKYSDAGIKMSGDMIIIPPEHIIKFFEKYQLFKEELSKFSEVYSQCVSTGFSHGSLNAHPIGMPKAEYDIKVSPFSPKYPVEIGLWMYKHDDKDDYWGTVGYQILEHVFPGLAEGLDLTAISGSKEGKTRTRSTEFLFGSIDDFDPIGVAKKVESLLEKTLAYKK